MKLQYRGLYVYVGLNGFIFALEFDFRSKSYSIEHSLFWCSVDSEGLN